MSALPKRNISDFICQLSVSVFDASSVNADGVLSANTDLQRDLIQKRRTNSSTAGKYFKGLDS